jgi:arylsulfatase A-like enzyme
MRSWLRSLLLSSLLAASLGVLGGAVIAAKEILVQNYPRLGLWRTTLWILCTDTSLGAGVGGAAGAVVVMVLVGWPAALSLFSPRRRTDRLQRANRAGPELAPRLALLLAMCATAVVTLAPTAARVRLGLPYWLATTACLAVFLVVASGSAALSSDSDDGAPSAWLKLVWPVLVGSAYLAAVLHIWARVEDARRAVIVAGLALLAVLLGYRSVYRPAQSLLDLLGRTLGPRVGLPSAARLSIGALGCTFLVWAVGWMVRFQARAEAHRAGLNVVVIAVDTLRWDAVNLRSQEEHGRDLTPNLRRLLAPRAVVFPNAISQAPWTLPAFASIFTGLYPEEHGAQHFISELSPEQATIAELVREAGYLTMAVVSGHYVSSQVGMTQGFTLCDESQVPDAGRAITSGYVTERARALLAAHQAERFFLFLHYFDPHHLYLDHPEFNFAQASPDPALEGPPNTRLILSRYGTGPLSPAQSASVRALYDEEVAYTDLQIGRVLAFLGEAGLWESTCVIFVADHGEEFLEHGSTGHDKTLFQEVVHVPLALADPTRTAPAVITRPVETRWLFGTMLDAAHATAPHRQRPSPTLFAAPGSDRHHVRTATHPMPEGGGSASRQPWLSCLIGDRYKLIRDHLAGSVRLFDLAADPGESRDLSHDRPGLTSQLCQALETWDAEVSRGAATRRPPRLTEEELRRVRDLGYL